MKVHNLDKPLLNEEGNEFPDKTTVRKALSIAAATPVQEQESADAKYKLGMIAIKLNQARKGVVELSAEDITLLKDRIGKLYGPIVVIRLYDLLEGKQAAEKRIPAEELEPEEPEKELKH